MDSLLVARCLGVVLFVAFAMAGLLKLTPWLDKFAGATQEEMTQNFRKFAKVCPLEKAGFHVDPIVYRNVAGAIELLSAIMMLVRTGIVSKVGNLMLVFVMFGAIYTHIAIGDPWQQFIPATSLCGLLAIRFILLVMPPGNKTGNKKIN